MAEKEFVGDVASEETMFKTVFELHKQHPLLCVPVSVKLGSKPVLWLEAAVSSSSVPGSTYAS